MYSYNKDKKLKNILNILSSGPGRLRLLPEEDKQERTLLEVFR